jgi:hypothetical protein
MDLEAIRELNQGHVAHDPAIQRAALERMGNPSSNELIELALEGLGDPDRNVRFQMLRLLGTQVRPEAAPGILHALSDPARRVRKLALRLSVLYAGNPAIEARLVEICFDENETRKIHSAAFLALSSGRFLASLATSSDAARKYFEGIPELEKYRRSALNLLVSLDPLTDPMRDVLRYIVEAGDEDEAAMATRALSGFRVINLAGIPAPERKRVAQTCELAWGRVLYWVPRAPGRQ